MYNNLLKLLAENRRATARRPLALRALGANEAEIFLYDIIVDSELEAEWWGGGAPEPFARELRGITAGTIHLRINSPGGSVFGARAMEQALREHKAKVIVHVDGLAASAASFLAMAGDEVVMAKGAMLMIHNAWTIALGNAAELRKTADLLSKIDGTLAQTYADRTGGKVEDIAAQMAEETWFTAEEAVDHGFADAIAEAPKGDGDTPAAAWNLSAYLRAPAARQPKTEQPQPEQSPAPAGTSDAEKSRSEHRARRAALACIPFE